MPTPAPISDISPTGLLAKLACDTPPMILDVRLPEDRATLPVHLPGALWVSHLDRDALIAHASTGSEVVVSCAKGRKLTYGVASILAAAGITVLRQTGGIAAWQAANLPLAAITPCGPLVVPTQASPEEALQIWSVRRFALPNADVLQVPQEHLADVAKAFEATLWLNHLQMELPHHAALTSAAISKELTLLLKGLDQDPIAALPLFDALFRGLLARDASKATPK